MYHCRRCGNTINDLWNDWELCDTCGYRFHTIELKSPDDTFGRRPKKIHTKMVWNGKSTKELPHSGEQANFAY